MSNIITSFKCSKERIKEILLDPIKYNLTEYDKMEKVNETCFIQYFGKNDELRMTYDILSNFENNKLRIIIVNEEYNVEIIGFKILECSSLEVKIEVTDEIFVKGLKQQAQNKFLKFIDADKQSLNSLINHINEFLK
ncbi:MAG: hypothetical protein RR623_09640 [Bacilli bacterium]